MDEKYEADIELQIYEQICGKILQLQRDRASCYRELERIDKEMKALMDDREKIKDKYIKGEVIEKCKTS